MREIEGPDEVPRFFVDGRSLGIITAEESTITRPRHESDLRVATFALRLHGRIDFDPDKLWWVCIGGE